jgi:hypothetical protein
MWVSGATIATLCPARLNCTAALTAAAVPP